MNSRRARSVSLPLAAATLLFLCGCGARDGLYELASGTGGASSVGVGVTPGNVSLGCGPTDAPVILVILAAETVACATEAAAPYVEVSIVPDATGGVPLGTPITIGTDLDGSTATHVEGASGQFIPGTGTITFSAYDPDGGAAGSTSLLFADDTTQDGLFAVTRCTPLTPCGG